MRVASDLFVKVCVSQEQARSLRQAAREGRSHARALMARARSLRFRLRNVEAQLAEAEVQAGGHIGDSLGALRLEIVEQLRQSLSDLESIRMIPDHDPKLRDLKADIRKSIQGSEIR